MARIARRGVLGLLGAAALPAAAAEPAWLSAAADAEGRWRAVAFGLDGAPRLDLALPARGHGAAVSPDGAIAVLFGRRPGAFAQILHPTAGRAGGMIERATGRWFCGHGAFSADGRLLYATELDEAGEGVVGVYAVPGFARIGEFPTGGADPHDIRLAPDGRALWVANGGIRTDPSLPRARLDLESFESSLVLLDAASGALLDRRGFGGEDAMLSLRHLALAAGGVVFVAMQHEGPRYEHPPLIAATQAEGLAAVEAESWRMLDHYTGSAASGAGGALVAVTSPRGGRGVIIEARTRRIRAGFALRDGCGVAAAPGGFLLTSGFGAVRLVGEEGALRDVPAGALGGLRWDNHLVPL